MVDMGVPAYLVASSVVAVLAQRLVRVVCQKCKQPYMPNAAILESAGITTEMLSKAKFARGRGCNACGKSGYKGRLGIYELMSMTSKVRELAFQGKSTQEIRKAAQAAGMRTLFDDGVAKSLQGVTTLEEVFRVAKRTEN